METLRIALESLAVVVPGKRLDRRREMRAAVTILLWAVGIAGCLIIKKIQPEFFKLYFAWMLFICGGFTVLSATCVI